VNIQNYPNCTLRSVPPKNSTCKSVHFFLSEMSISNLHGGGLTLQRVLGPDLDSIGWFVHVDRFAQRQSPIENVAGRSLGLWPWLSSDWARRWLGRRVSENFPHSPITLRLHAQYVAKRLSRILPNGVSIRALVCPQGKQSIVCIDELRKHLDLRYITWMMDDHVIRWCKYGWKYPVGFRSLMGWHLQSADTVFVISPAMREFYREEFGVNSEVLFGPSELENEAAYRVPSDDGHLRIGYFGRIWEWNLDALASLAQAMARDSEDELHIYAPPEDPLDKLRSVRNVKIRSAISSDMVAERMRQYDALLIPISFDDNLRYLTEFNIATKMSECIASGTVTIVYGPPHAAMVRFLSNTGAAIILQKESVPNWNEISERIRNPTSRQQMLQKASTLTTEQLSTSVMRNRWRNAVSRLTTSS
jgi:glycosyltransferase involved in cell wall biosynthesis